MFIFYDLSPECKTHSAGVISVLVITLPVLIEQGHTNNKYLWKKYGLGTRERRGQWTGHGVSKKTTPSLKALSRSVFEVVRTYHPLARMLAFIPPTLQYPSESCAISL